MKKRHAAAKIVKTAHLDDWRERAVSLGWPQTDLDALASIMRVAKTEQRVVDVAPLEITIYEIASFRIGGTDHTNVYSENNIDASGVWKWRYKPQAEPVLRKDEERIPWCPSHAFGCNPTVDGKCGVISLANVIACDCPPMRDFKPRFSPQERHMPNCEVFLRESQGRMAEQVRLMVERKQQADIEADESVESEFKPMVAVPLKQKKRKKGEPLPGQISLLK